MLMKLYFGCIADETLLDFKITRIHVELEEITTTSNNIQLLPLLHLPCHFFTNCSVHLNTKGKTKVADMVIQFINKDS